MPNFADTACTRVTEQLDRFEESLPELPARIFRLQRAVARRAYDTTSGVVDAVSTSARNVFETTRLSGRTVVGQARAAGTQVTDSARTAASTVAGQTTAQGRQVARTASRETNKLVDSALDAVEDTVEDAEAVVDEQSTTSRRYEDRTKAELLERAQELDIDGRSQMNKRQLIAALRKAS